MTPHFDFEVYTTETYRQIVAAADPDEGINRQEAMDLALTKILAAIERGDIKPDMTDTVKRALLNADDQQGKRADKLIRTFLVGQEMLSIDDDLNTVVILGAGRRKLWRHCTPDDLILMDKLRYENYRNAHAAYDQWREGYTAAFTAVMQHQTVEGAVRAISDGES